MDAKFLPSYGIDVSVAASRKGCLFTGLQLSHQKNGGIFLKTSHHVAGCRKKTIPSFAKF